MRKKVFALILLFKSFIIFWGCLSSQDQVVSSDKHKNLDFDRTKETKDCIAQKSDKQNTHMSDGVIKTFGSRNKKEDNILQKTNQIIVKFKQPHLRNRQSFQNAIQANIQKLFSTSHLKNLTNVKTIASMGLVVLKNLDLNTSVEEQIQRLSANPLVEYAEPDWAISVNALPSDPLFSEQWAWHQESGIDIMASGAWDISHGSNDVLVAVIDTGIDYKHEDLAANIWRNPGEIAGNGIDDDNNGYVDDVHGINAILGNGDPMDDHYHGTHCAGIIGAVGNNQVGVTGACWNVKLMSLKFLDGNGRGLTSDAIACIDYAIEMGAQILSNSWGSEEYSLALRDAIGRAEEAGILFVAAAGNSSESSDELPLYPAAMANENILSVASINKWDELSYFSNYGPESIDIAAPGSDILSTLPTSSTFSMLQKNYPTDYHTLSGTSMAAPHVAGIAALLKAHDSTLTWRGLKDTLMRTATRKSYLSDKVKSSGVLNAKYALMDDAPPSVAFTNIDNTSIVKGVVPIELRAEDDKGVAKVEVYIDDDFLGDDNSFPFSISWDTMDFSDRTRHTIEARVVDIAGRTDSAKITVMTNNSYDPAVYIHSISPQVLYQQATPVEMTIQPEVQIAKTELYIDNTLVDTDVSSPWSFKWNTPAFTSGQHVITVRAYDMQMKTYEDSVLANSKQGIPSEEREALIALYNNTDGDNWRKKTHWKKDDGSFSDWGTEHNWHGILLSGGRVIQLDLSNNNLRGTLPNELSQLKNLSVVSLNGNDLIDPFPWFLKECAQLKSLNLGSNEFSGVLSPEIGQMNRLEFLALDDNHFTGAIPAELANLKQLKTLLLGWNRFTGHIPRELAAMPNLEKLLVNSNLLREEILGYYLDFPDGFFFSYNGFYTNDDALRESLEQKFPSWHKTQTVPPKNIAASFAGDGIVLSWTPNEWQDVIGFSASPDGPRRYRLYHSNASGGPYELLSETPDDETSSLKITSFDTASRHFFVVTMFSPIFQWLQYLKSEIESEYSEEVVFQGVVPTDNTSPQILEVTPADGLKVQGDVKLSMNASDPDSGIAWVSVEIVHHGSNSRVELFESASNPISFNWDTQTAADGVYKIVFRAYDHSGNWRSRETTIEVKNRYDDQQPPQIVWHTPYNGIVINGLTTVGLNAIDGNKGPSSVFRISSEIVHENSGLTVKRFAAGPQDKNYFTWNSGQVQNGNYKILFKAFDMAGNVASNAISISVMNSPDETPPTIVHLSPANGDVVEGYLSFFIDAKDEQNNLSKVSVAVIDPKTGTQVASFESTSSPATFAWDTRQVENGKYTAIFRASDSWNNVAVSEINISVENNVADISPPILGAFCPDDGDILAGEVELSLTAVDVQSGIEKLIIEVVDPVGGTTVAFFESALSTARHTWDSEQVPDGKYKIQYRADDMSGNTAARDITVTVDNNDDRPEVPDRNARVSKYADFSTTNENFETIDIVYLEAWDPDIDFSQMKKAQYTFQVATFSDTGNLENREGIFYGAIDLSRYPIQGAPKEGEIRIELEDSHEQISQFTIVFLLWPVTDY